MKCLIALLLFFIVTVVPLSAQQPQQRPQEQQQPQQQPKPAQQAAPAATDEVATFKSGVSYVRVDVQVTNDKNLVRDLAQDDFIVHDNGAIQPVTYFSREHEPMSLILLLDVSGSMRKYLEEMAAVSGQALKHLRTGDRVATMLFGKSSKVHQDFTGDIMEVSRLLKTAVSDEELLGGTNINSAILDAIEHLHQYHKTRAGHDLQEGKDRHAILIVTDNLGMNYKVPDEKVVKALFEADAVLNAIVVGRAQRPERTEATPKRYVNPDFTYADVWKLAEQTGGEAVPSKKAGESFIEMIDRIRMRYGLHYRPPEARAGTFRRIRVDLTPEARKRYPQAILRYRSGYYASEQ